MIFAKTCYIPKLLSLLGLILQSFIDLRVKTRHRNKLACPESGMARVQLPFFVTAVLKKKIKKLAFPGHQLLQQGMISGDTQNLCFTYFMEYRSPPLSHAPGSNMGSGFLQMLLQIVYLILLWLYWLFSELWSSSLCIRDVVQPQRFRDCSTKKKRKKELALTRSRVGPSLPLV